MPGGAPSSIAAWLDWSPAATASICARSGSASRVSRPPSFTGAYSAQSCLIRRCTACLPNICNCGASVCCWTFARTARARSEEHTSELQSRENLVCRLLLEKKKKNIRNEQADQLRRQVCD